MDAKDKKFTSIRFYEDFQAPSQWVKEDGTDVLRISLPGFNKDQIKVQMDNQGKLRVTGERPLTGNRWGRFRNDFLVPADANSSEIRAIFQDNFLLITMPKLVVPKIPKVQEMTSQNVSAKKIGEKKDDLVVNVAVAVLMFVVLVVYLSYNMIMRKNEAKCKC